MTGGDDLEYDEDSDVQCYRCGAFVGVILPTHWKECPTCGVTISSIPPYQREEN